MAPGAVLRYSAASDWTLQLVRKLPKFATDDTLVLFMNQMPTLP